MFAEPMYSEEVFSRLGKRFLLFPSPSSGTWKCESTQKQRMARVGWSFLEQGQSFVFPDKFKAMLSLYDVIASHWKEKTLSPNKCTS